MAHSLHAAWFERLGPSSAESPLVCAVPHAGRTYPQALLAASAVPQQVLEQLEDRHADLLVSDVLKESAAVIVARVARAYIDLNRGEEDLEVASRPDGSGPAQSARARSGLGLLPTRIGRRALWREQPSAASAEERIATIHRPYHAAIAAALEAARRRFGYAVLIDCHSMPPLSGNNPARFVIGDGHGRSAGKGVATAVMEAARKLGVTVALNAPYAGAYGIARHGRPLHHVHALQIEIDRTLYLDRELRAPSAGLRAAQISLAALAHAAVRSAQPPSAIAAE